MTETNEILLSALKTDNWVSLRVRRDGIVEFDIEGVWQPVAVDSTDPVKDIQSFIARWRFSSKVKSVEAVVIELLRQFRSTIEDGLLREESVVLTRQQVDDLVNEMPRSLRYNELSKYAASTIPRPKNKVLAGRAASDETWVRQMRVIDLPAIETCDAVWDYIKTDGKITEMLEEGLITQEDLDAYHEELLRAYHSEKGVVKDSARSDADDEAKGRALFRACNKLDIPFFEVENKSISRGSFQKLADNPDRLTWHWDWQRAVSRYDQGGAE